MIEVEKVSSCDSFGLVRLGVDGKHRVSEFFAVSLRKDEFGEDPSAWPISAHIDPGQVFVGKELSHLLGNLVSSWPVFGVLL